MRSERQQGARDSHCGVWLPSEQEEEPCRIESVERVAEGLTASEKRRHGLEIAPVAIGHLRCSEGD
jgi:hypothetical protein